MRTKTKEKLINTHTHNGPLCIRLEAGCDQLNIRTHPFDCSQALFHYGFQDMEAW
eukprot:m.84580 g.84580  ORF g.84580 m.84580 type:complete len:55 (-) comp12162_c0_seq2:1212-1376(-)